MVKPTACSHLLAAQCLFFVYLQIRKEKCGNKRKHSEDTKQREQRTLTDTFNKPSTNWKTCGRKQPYDKQEELLPLRQ